MTPEEYYQDRKDKMFDAALIVIGCMVGAGILFVFCLLLHWLSKIFASL